MAHKRNSRHISAHFSGAVRSVDIFYSVITSQSETGYTFSYFSKFLHVNDSTVPRNRSLPLPTTSIITILSHRNRRYVTSAVGMRSQNNRLINCDSLSTMYQLCGTLGLKPMFETSENTTELISYKI